MLFALRAFGDGGLDNRRSILASSSLTYTSMKVKAVGKKVHRDVTYGNYVEKVFCSLLFIGSFFFSQRQEILDQTPQPDHVI